MSDHKTRRRILWNEVRRVLYPDLAGLGFLVIAKRAIDDDAGLIRFERARGPWRDELTVQWDKQGAACFVITFDTTQQERMVVLAQRLGSANPARDAKLFYGRAYPAKASFWRGLVGTGPSWFCLARNGDELSSARQVVAVASVRIGEVDRFLQTGEITPFLGFPVQKR